MNEHYENYDMDEMEIDLIDFLFYLLRRWKSLVAMILLGAILGSAFYVVKTTKSSNAAVEDYQPDADTEANMKLAAQYRKLYDQQMDYNEHSIVMQMDPNQVYEGTLTYYLAAGEQTERLAQLFTDIVNDPAVLAELKAAAGLDCKDQYVKELVSSTMLQENVDESSVSGSLTSNIVTQMQVTVPSDGISNTVITYQVAYLDQKTCEKMVEVLRNAIESAAQKYVDAYGEYEFDQLQSVVAVTVDEKYLEKQKTSAALVDSCLTKLAKLEDAFDDTERDYYQTAYLSNNSNSNTQEQMAQKNISLKVMCKWLLVGIVVFAFIWGTLQLAKYLTNSGIKTLDEVKKMKLPVVGYVRNEKAHMSILDRMEQKRNGISDSIDYIAATINAFPEQQILLCGDLNNVWEQQMLDEVQKRTSNLAITDWIHEDITALKNAKKSDGVIFAINLRKTSMKQLQRALDICKLHKIIVLGAIVTEE